MVELADLIDGGFNLTGFIFLIIAIGVLAVIFVKKRKISSIIILIIAMGGMLYTIANVLDKWQLADSDIADGLSGSFALIMATVAFIYAFLPALEGRLERTNFGLKKVLKTATDASINIANIATELAASASEVNASSEEIAATTQEVTVVTQDIRESSNDIENIMNVVTSISDQTNLLALNASIEAGRAGEHGRGFAVVAEEVRKLAEESRNSVKESKEKISEILEKIHIAYSSMEGINASTEEQSSSMEEIAATAQRLGALAEQLKTSLKKF
ncbi:MAG: methyl-accepting chemotaxis protein [Promethearchaeota archaeon]